MGHEAGPEFLEKMINKRGETESYSFLIGLIITFLMLTTVGCVIYQIYSKGSDTEDSFKNLVETVKGLKDGGEGKLPLYIDEDHIIVGFRSDTDKVESKAVLGLDIIINYCYDWYTGGYEGLLIERPPACKGKGCICLCKYNADKPKTLTKYEKYINSGMFITKDVCSGKEDTCITDDKISNYNFIGQGGCEIAFIPGIKGAIFLGIKSLKPGMGVMQNRGTAPVYYKRTGDTIAIYDEQPSKEEIIKGTTNATGNNTPT
jgi:hypothetical protein